jgi:pimeloyl-ACP methyl ester carboxylesterase
MSAATIKPFKATISVFDIADLRSRLARTRWTDWLPDSGWSYGTDEVYIKRLCDYWQDGFDFNAFATRLNAYPQFLAEVEGEQLHFYHVRSTVPTARPLVLVHGWPGSIVEFLDLIGPLCDPETYGGNAADAYHVIVPSLPGYGFSGPTRHKDVNAAKAGAMIVGVMEALGYPRFFIQGGDWGSIVTSGMAQNYPDKIAALHVNMAPGGPSDPSIPAEGLDDAEAAEYDKLGQHMAMDTGYAYIQSTRPQTLAVAMNDSPAGLAAWIIDKFHAWTDHGGDLDAVFDFDHLLDNLSLYWFTGTAGSSFRLYHENNFRSAYAHAVVDVPTGIARFAGEPFRWPRSLVERNYRNVQDWQEIAQGGHFAAFQRKDDFLRVVRGFFADQAL